MAHFRPLPLLLILVALVSAPGLAAGERHQAQPRVDPAVVNELAPTGELRVAINLAGVGQASRDPATGELRGVTIDLGRELASRLGIAFVPSEYVGFPGVISALETEAVDVAFLAITTDRAASFDFSPPYMEIDETCLVPAGSPIRTVADADQPGVRIVVAQGGARDELLTEILVHAELVRIVGAQGFDAAALALLASGQAEAFCQPRPNLLELLDRLPGSRVLEDRFGVGLHAMALTKGRARALSYVTDFVEEAKASGLVQRSVERHGVRGVQVAPVATPVQPVDQAVLADLASTGELRISMNLAQPAGVVQDPESGELRGVTVDLGRELATRLGVPFTPVEYRGFPPIVRDLQAGILDVGFLGIVADTAAQVDLTPANMELDDTYLVRPGSPFHSVTELDQPGVRIATGGGATTDFLSESLREGST